MFFLLFVVVVVVVVVVFLVVTFKSFPRNAKNLIDYQICNSFFSKPDASKSSPQNTVEYIFSVTSVTISDHTSTNQKKRTVCLAKTPVELDI